MQIGKKIKELRLKNDLTLEELASRSELTKGFLSQLERDLTSPSVSTLEDVLEALGTNLYEFFEKPKEEKIVFKKQDFFVDKQEDKTIEWIVPNAQKNDMEPIVLTLSPQASSQVITGHDGEEFGFVLKGMVDLIIGDKKHRIKANETFYISNEQSHHIYNPGKSDAKILWITTPPMF